MTTHRAPVARRGERSSARLSTWQVVSLVLLLAIATYGCNQDGGAAGAPAPWADAQPAAPVAATSALARAPEPVRTAFAKHHPGSTVTRVRHRLMPDGSVHYTLSSTDARGESREDVYHANGTLVSSPDSNR
jgi:hypothetical protein